MNILLTNVGRRTYFIDFLNDLKKTLYFLRNVRRGSVKSSDIPYFENYSSLMPTYAALNIIKSVASFLEIIYNTKAGIILQ